MSYEILIGQRTYSSWSMRGWLPFAAFDIPVVAKSAVIYSDEFYDDVKAFGGVRTVPVVRTPEGGILTDSLAIAWHLAEAFPNKPMLPKDPKARAMAQSIIAEMHSGFAALRGACPMNLRHAWEGFEPSDAVKADLARIETIMGAALDMSGGPFLFGGYSLADAFYAPVAMRVAGYRLPVSERVQAYVDAQLTYPPMVDWRAKGLEEDAVVGLYNQSLPPAPWPV